MPAKFQVGEKIQDRWQILRLIETGSNILYVVFDPVLKRSLVAKTLRDEAVSKSVNDRFREVAQAWINLGLHANIVGAHLVDTVDDRPFLFIDYLPVGSLAQRMPKNIPQALRYAIHICDGMAHASAKGIHSHGALKPHNCLITQDGTLKVSDFGMAKVLHASGESTGSFGTGLFHRIATGAFHTVPKNGDSGNHGPYLAPELRTAPWKHEVRSDLYSFGVILFEMITGHLPVASEKACATKTLERLAAVDRSHILKNILDSCLSQNLIERPKNFSVVRDQLAEVYQRLTGHPIKPPESGDDLNTIEGSRETLSLRELGLHEHASEYLKHVLDHTTQRADLWLTLGERFAGMCRWNDAIRCYDHALDLEPRNAVALACKGLALLETGNKDEAWTCAELAVEVAPKSDIALRLMGTIWSNMGRIDEALECFDKAIDANPDSDEAWLQKAALLKVEHPGDAITCLDRALELNPVDDDAWVMKGELMGIFDRNTDEVFCYDRAIEINPRNANAWYEKGVALSSSFNRYREAMTCFEQAEKLGHPKAAEGITTCKPLLDFTERTDTYRAFLKQS